MRHFKFTTRPIHTSDNSCCNIEYIIQRKIRQQEHIVTSILATPLFFRWKRFFILRTMKKKGVWCYKQLQWQMKVVFLYLFARYGGECPHLVEHILHGEIRTTQGNFLWLLRTNDEALCLYVWVAHLALDANNLCVHMYESAFFCVPVGKPIYFCAICVSIYILAPCDVCVCGCSYACTIPESLYMCVHSFQVYVWRVVRDGGGSAPLTQPLCHADISRVEEIITLCSP